MNDNPYQSPAFVEPQPQPQEDCWLEQLLATVVFIVGLPLVGLAACIAAVWIAVEIVQALTS